MSALIFYIDDDRALVATDTLATTPAGQALFFTSKAYHLPHLHTIVAGTGYGVPIAEWFMHVNTGGRMFGGVEELAEYAPRALRGIWANFRRGDPHVGSTTVYQFGVSELTGKVVGFAFRSANGFTAERLPGGGTGIKPADGVTHEFTGTESMPAIMEEMRAAQAKEPDPAKRIHVGGEIVVFHLTPEGFGSGVIHRFPDADDQAAAMRERAAR